MFDLIRGLYPFGEINLPDEDSEDLPPRVANAAKFRTATANGAKITLSEGVFFTKGDSKITADGEGSRVIVGKGVHFEGTVIQVNGPDCLVLIGDKCRLKGLTIAVRSPGSIVMIGAGTSWESGAIISQSGNVVALGNDCMVSNSVVVRTSDGHAIFDAETRLAINNSADLFIGHHVWLGNSSRVNKGARIGSGTILGQCAIASGTLDPNCVYGGVPAKKIKQGVLWSRTAKFSDIPVQYQNLSDPA